MTASRLDAFFAPRSVAVVGAGERATSSGGAVMQMLKIAGYAGRVVPVNPRGGEIFGYKAATSLAEIDEPCDLAVIVIRSDAIPGTLREAAASNHRNILILPGGFAEAGAPGLARDAEVRAIASEHGLLIAGPNCAGLIHLDPAWRFAATFLRDVPPGIAAGAGNGIALISQSGALAEEVIAKANERALPLTTVVSVGNGMHLGVEDYLEHLVAQDAIGTLLLYVESIADVDRFRDVARAAAARKPVIALFGGRTEIGGRAARAHTGAAINDDAAIDEFCNACGILRVTSLRRLLIAAKAFGRFPQGLGRRALVLSNSGGPGVLATDRAALEGLDLAPLPQVLTDTLRAVLPPEASVANPLDLLADAREDRFAATFAAVVEHSRQAWDQVLMIHVVPFMVDAAPVVSALRQAAANAPFAVMHAMMGTLPGKDQWFADLEKAGIPVFNDVEEMAEAAGMLARYPLLQASLNRPPPNQLRFRARV
ncbi:MAG: CoA-binding protein [Reyranellaceae bacterium]